MVKMYTKYGQNKSYLLRNRFVDQHTQHTHSTTKIPEFRGMGTLTLFFLCTITQAEASPILLIDKESVR
jgi:hypothetical protein